MDKSVFISIVIPCYNSAKTIRHCIQSIVNQKFDDWEICVMDGLSQDDTLPIVQSFCDERIRVFSEKDKGIYDAMNKGVEKAHGDWLYFLGSDDSLHDENVLIQIAQYIKDSNCDVLYGDVNAPQLLPVHKGAWNISTIGYNRCHQAIFYKHALLKKYKGYNLKYKVHADHELNLRWFFDMQVKHKYVPIVIANYADGGLSARNGDAIFDEDFPKLILEYGMNTLMLKDKCYYIKEVLSCRSCSGFYRLKFVLLYWITRLQSKLS